MAKDGKQVRIPVFIWQGLDKGGLQTQGEIAAKNFNAAKALLRHQGITPSRVKRKPRRVFSARKPRIKAADIAVFSRLLATMMSSGAPLMQSLKIIGEGHENVSMQTLILSVKADVESGTSLTKALGRFPRYFDVLLVNLVNAGEQSGSLETMLDEIASYKEKTEALKAKIKKALVYPVAIVLIAFVVTAILMIVVVPQFEVLFLGFGAELPALTKTVIVISQFFQQFWWLILAFIIAVVYGVVSARRRSQKVHYMFDQVVLRLPIIGLIMEKAAIARFARTLATMLKAGVPLVEAMGAVAGATGNSVFNDGIMIMRDEVSTGIQLNVVMAKSRLFPDMVVQMVAIGEEAGSLDSMLDKVADFYEAKVGDEVDNMTTLLEPIIMAFLGVIIGTLVIAMYLPIFKLGSVI